MVKTTVIPEIGSEFGRPDMERIGLFAELGYLVGKKYTPVLKFSDIRDPKKRQMFPGGSKIKTGLQDCYFDTEFKRLFIGEAYPRKMKDGEKKKGKKGKVFNAGKPFVPPQYPNPLYSPGDAFGYFSTYDEFSPKTKPRKQGAKEVRGIYTVFPKFGGPGYTDMCINTYPEHIPDKYEPKDKLKKPKGKQLLLGPIHAGQYPNYFDSNPFFQEDPQPPYKKLKEVYMGKIGPTFRPSSPAKWDGGCKEGTIEKFPEYIEDRYYDPNRIDKLLEKIQSKKRAAKKQKPIGPVFKPPACCRTLQSPSVMARKVDIATHSGNWTVMKPITFTHKFIVI